MSKVKLKIITPTRNIHREVEGEMNAEDIASVVRSAQLAAEKSFPTLCFRVVPLSDEAFNIVGEYPERVPS